ncbi:hypothetical protein [Massilia sp. TWP1-3-3]|uniref:hypothetical protein n=1 Tax=Massilia sp. TWP1-3-3 TaxID=2804573 RepID=UPI003CE7F638
MCPALFTHLARIGCALVLLTGAKAGAQALRIIIPPIETSARGHAQFFPQALELALRKTESSHGAFAIDYYPRHVSVQRSVEELRAGKAINLIWTASNPAREEQLLPVRISLLRELNNYRVLLIREQDQAVFDQVRTADDLRKLRAGMGAQWVDSDIMRSNGYQVTTSLHYNALFEMLVLKRFDYFPRGLYEVWNEESIHREAGLRIEKSLMLYYPAPFYFFVNRKDKALAQRIELGLKIAQDDGSYERLMRSFPGIKRGLEEQKKGGRRLFVLDGPASQYAASKPDEGAQSPERAALARGLRWAPLKP